MYMIEIDDGSMMSIFDNPFFATLGLSILTAFFKVIFVERSLLIFISQIVNFPFWVLLLIYSFFYTIRSVRASRAYRLLHTVYHERGSSVAVAYTNSTNQFDEFGLQRQ